MEFKVYKLEFTYFCNANWKYKTIEITALTKISLMKEYLKETRAMRDDNLIGRKFAIKRFWENIIKDIEHINESYPKVKQLHY